jgi:hypothetical protein
VIDNRMKLVRLQEFHDSVHRCSLSPTGYGYARPRKWMARYVV